MTKYGLEIDDGLRTKCPGCKWKLSAAIKISESGVIGKRPAAWICLNPVCDRFVDPAKVETWKTLG